MATKVANPRKVFTFKVEIGGIDQFEIQSFKVPDGTIDVVLHGDTNHDAKTPGRIKFGDAVLKKIVATTNTDTWAWTWLMIAQDPFLGGGALPSAVLQDIIIKELDTTQQITINRWLMEGCFVSKVSQSDFDRSKSDNIIEEVTLAVTRCRKLPV